MEIMARDRCEVLIVPSPRGGDELGLGKRSLVANHLICRCNSAPDWDPGFDEDIISSPPFRCGLKVIAQLGLGVRLQMQSPLIRLG